MNPRATVAGALVSAVFLQDLTVTTRHQLPPGFDLQLGIRNIWNTVYFDPVGLAIDTIQQDGRSVYLKVIWHGRQ